MLGLNENIDQLAMADIVRWYGRVSRGEDGPVLRSALDFEFEGQKKKWILKRISKKQIEEESMIVGLRREDAIFHSRWSIGINLIAVELRRICPPSLVG